MSPLLNHQLQLGESYMKINVFRVHQAINRTGPTVEERDKVTEDKKMAANVIFFALSPPPSQASVAEHQALILSDSRVESRLGVSHALA